MNSLQDEEIEYNKNIPSFTFNIFMFVMFLLVVGLVLVSQG